MDKDQIKKSILEKPATETCEKIIKELIKANKDLAIYIACLMSFPHMRKSI
jgi:hypothetical protein